MDYAICWAAASARRRTFNQNNFAESGATVCCWCVASKGDSAMRRWQLALAVAVAGADLCAGAWLNSSSLSAQIDESNGVILNIVEMTTERSFGFAGGLASPLAFTTSNSGASGKSFTGAMMTNFQMIVSDVPQRDGKGPWSCLNMTWSGPNGDAMPTLGSAFEVHCSLCADMSNVADVISSRSRSVSGTARNPRQSGILARVDGVFGLPPTLSLASITFPLFHQPPRIASPFGVRLDGGMSACTVYDTDWLHPRFARASCNEVAAAAAAATTGNASDEVVDQLLLNLVGGVLLESPGMQTLTQRAARYPGAASFQLVARTDGVSGIGLMSLDGEGNVKTFLSESEAGQYVQTAVEHMVPEVPGGVCNYTGAPRDDPGNCTVTVPYPLAIFGYRGGWRSAADSYKAWVVEEAPWAGEQVATRTDIPSALQDGAVGWIGPVMTSRGFNPEPFGPNLENVSVQVAEYREMVGTRHVAFLPYGWEHDGTWAGINYFPATPSSQSWLRVSRELEGQGDMLGMLVSGYWWVVKRQATNSGPAFDNSAQVPAMEDMLCKLPNQTLWVDDQYNEPNGTQSWRGLSVRLCHGHPNATVTMQSIMETCNSQDADRNGPPGLGATLVSFDQEIGGGSSGPCYAHNDSGVAHHHEHAPGYGAWGWRGFRDTLDGIRAAANDAGREVGIMMEQCSELASTRAATFWSRQFAVIDYPFVNAHGLGVFSYLYHQNVTALAAAMVQGQGLGAPTATLRRQAIANAVVRGLPPVPFDSDVSPRFVDTQDPSVSWQRNITRSFAASAPLFASFTRYLLQGRTLRPP